MDSWICGSGTEDKIQNFGVISIVTFLFPAKSLNT